MAGLDDSLNWILEHWYYFFIIFLLMLLYKWYNELKKFKGQFIQWCDLRQDKIVKEEKVNPTFSFKWLRKQVEPFSDKSKRMGKIDTWKIEPTKTSGNPGGLNMVTVTARTRHIGKYIWWHPQVFVFQLDNVKLNEIKKTVLIPYNYYWERQPDETMALISPKYKETVGFVNDKIFKDLCTTAIDGFASQMTSYSSVKPTWGHEERMYEKEGESRAGFFEQFKPRKKKEEERD